MSLAVVVAVGVVGGLGAIGRFVLDGTVSERAGRAFPFGTLAVNVAGSLLLGVIAGAAIRGDSYTVLAAGLLGSFTTFSTWALESHRLAEDGESRLAALNFAAGLALGVAAAWIGRELGGVL